jgi:septal ring factor EnvC (AmiA/AmiB activator)
MPKIAIIVISVAFGFFIGFLGGAFLTTPQNKEMEQLVRDKKETQTKLEDSKKQGATLEENINRLRSANDSLKITNESLRNKLLAAYQNSQETKDTTTESGKYTR